MPRARRLFLALAGAVLSAIASTASAAPSPADVAVAQRAFDEASQLFRTEHFEVACEKFALSQRLDPKLGTLLNLAICHEKIGKLALASIEYHDARSLALAENKADRVDFADKHIAAIAPRLALLRIQIAPENRGKLSVTLDGSALGDAALDAEIPVDPGSHRVVANAPGATGFTGDVRCDAGAKCTVDVPALALASTAPAPAGESGHGGRIAGAVLLGTGVAGIVAGGIFGGLALHQRTKAEELCALGQCASGQTENDRGVAYAWVSNVAIGVGVAFAIVGVVLVIVDPGHKAPVRAVGNGVGFDF